MMWFWHPEWRRGCGFTPWGAEGGGGGAGDGRLLNPHHGLLSHCGPCICLWLCVSVPLPLNWPEL